MPFTTIATGDFCSVEFKPTSNAAWVSYTPRPGFDPGALADAIVDGSPLAIYVIDDASGYFSYEGGEGFGYDDTHLVAASTIAFTPLDITSDQGQTQHWAKSPSNVVYMLDPSTQLLHSFPAGDVAALKAFLP